VSGRSSCLAVSQPGCALLFHPLCFSRRDRLRSELDGPIALTLSDVIVRCDGLLVRSGWRAGPEHDLGEAEVLREGMQLIVGAGCQDKPWVGGVLAENLL